MSIKEQTNSKSTIREHAEFHNQYTKESVINDIKFLQYIYGRKIKLQPEDVNLDFRNKLRKLGKDIYFFLLTLENDV